jgi:hypothetical protein
MNIEQKINLAGTGLSFVEIDKGMKYIQPGVVDVDWFKRRFKSIDLDSNEISDVLRLAEISF